MRDGPQRRYPLVEALWGAAALQLAALVDAGNALVVCGLAFTLLHAAPPGRARGERKHVDGGVYDGEWRDVDQLLVKEGCVPCDSSRNSASCLLPPPQHDETCVCAGRDACMPLHALQRMGRGSSCAQAAWLPRRCSMRSTEGEFESRPTQTLRAKPPSGLVSAASAASPPPL